MKRPTITDVADKAQVSKATVSAVLNNHASVGAGSRQKVEEAIATLNYRPDGSARRLKSRPARAIGLVVKELDNPFYTEITSGARAYAHSRGYTLLIASSEGDYQQEKIIVDLFKTRDVQGVILSPVLDEHTDLSHLFELKRLNYPFVLLEAIRGVQANLVDIDNVEASRKAVEHLIAGGHNRIVHFAGPTYSTHSQERIEGVRRAFAESRLIFSGDVIVQTGSQLADGHRMGLACFGPDNHGEQPTAVTCFNDLVALGLLGALRRLGLRVPEDVSVVGYDDLSLLNQLGVSLTTVHSPNRRMGEKAAEILLRHIESPGGLPLEKIYLAADLIVRDSTTPLGHPVSVGSVGPTAIAS